MSGIDLKRLARRKGQCWGHCVLLGERGQT